MDKEEMEKVIRNNSKLVKKIAFRLRKKLPSSVQVEDLLQAGMLGLLNAAENYDASQGASFETYASIRIFGEMLDDMRRTDWIPRSVHRNTRLLEAAIIRIENKNGKPAKDAEIAKELGISIEKLHAIRMDISMGRTLQLNEGSSVYFDGEFLKEEHSRESELPENCVERQELLRLVSALVASLPEMYRMSIEFYYGKSELSLRKIGELFGFTESCACIHLSAAREKLKNKIKQHYDVCL